MKHSHLCITIIIVFSLVFTGCIAPQPDIGSGTPAPTGLVEATSVALSASVEPSIQPTNLPSATTPPLVPTATQTALPELSRTPTSPLPATELPQPAAPLPPGWIAFGVLDIRIIQTNGMGKRAIIEHERVPYPTDPKWSPDGQWIAFTGVPESSDAQIFLVRPDGSDLRQLTHTPGYKGSLDWSPDGQAIVYTQVTAIGDLLEREWTVDLFVYQIKTFQIRQLTDTPGIAEHEPAYSPVGDILAFLSYEEEGLPFFGKLMALDLASNTTRVLVETNLSIRYFAWSPDGSQIAIVAKGAEGDWDSCNEIYIVNSDGSGLRQITATPAAHYSELSWYPGGNWIVFFQAKCNYPNAPGFNDLYGMQISEGQAVLISNTGGYFVDWSPWAAVELGQRLYITNLGADLKLRSAPSLSGEIIKKLAEGDAITVLEGPVEADEYLWWWVRVNDGEDEGWIAENPGWFSSEP